MQIKPIYDLIMIHHWWLLVNVHSTLSFILPQNTIVKGFVNSLTKHICIFCFTIKAKANFNELITTINTCWNGSIYWRQYITNIDTTPNPLDIDFTSLFSHFPSLLKEYFSSTGLSHWKSLVPSMQLRR